MSASILTTASPGLYQTSPFRQRQNDFQALGNALQSGDLDAAQKAFAQLQADAPPPGQASSGSTASTSSAADKLKQDFQTLADALKAGNLDDAKTAFQQLQDDAKAARQAHGHGHHHRAEQAQSGEAANSNGAAASGQPASFTITETNISFTA
ncbi:MAG: hypothetical protein GC202_05355 [Alphaproteobacteria bacterium]|nr:hypothetical protein [Alphaproteobacteria bacterium]